VPQYIWDHVIRCQSVNAEYYGNKEEKRHLNVLVPLGVPRTGMNAVRLLYSFMCQNACHTGMNQKPFEVVFTLEDEVGTIYGRKKLSVKVCSCPKRGKEKEENDFFKKMSFHGAALPNKRRKTKKVGKKSFTVISALDTRQYTAK
ncbi:hypothetical protein ILUMI_15383, partial [Ignelater luminosus]